MADSLKIRRYSSGRWIGSCETTKKSTCGRSKEKKSSGRWTQLDKQTSGWLLLSLISCVWCSCRSIIYIYAPDNSLLESIPFMDALPLHS